MKKTICILIAVCTVLSISSPLFAESDTWKEPSYDFSQVKKILVFPAIISPEVENPLAFEKSMEFISTFMQREEIDYLMLEDIYPQIVEKVGNDFLKDESLPLEDRIGKLVQESKPYGDMILQLQVFDCAYSYQQEEGCSVPYTSYENVYLYGNIQGYASVPVTKYINVPSYQAKYSNASCMISLYEVEEGSRFWAFTASKSRETCCLSKISDLGVLKILVKDGIKKLPLK